MNNTAKSAGKASQQAQQQKIEEEQANKPLSTTLFQEIQNLKDKFKSDEDSQDRGLFLMVFFAPILSQLIL